MLRNAFKRILFVILAVLAFEGASVFACECAGERPACQEYGEASAVFIGTVINSRIVTVKESPYLERMRAVRISLDESFRGVEGAEVEVLTGFGGGDCGFGFRETQQYLVYAYLSEQDQKLHTSICTRTKLISAADKDLAYIRGLSKAKPGAMISGEIVKNLRNDTDVRNQPLAGVKVIVEGEKKFEAVTDDKGQYRLDQLPEGEYIVKPVLPGNLATRGPDRKVKLADRGCAEVSFWLESSARMTGRVLNPQGLAVPKAEIFMIEADKERYRGHWDAAYSDEEGKYSFNLIPPGRYVLIIRYDGMTSQNRPFPTIYYPGVSDKSQAKVFAIGEGQVVDNYDLQVPPMPTEGDVQGIVVWADGRPAAGARVEYEMSGQAIMYGAKVDEQGHFSFKAYQDLKLTLRASIEIEKGK
ncbi:MAG TPA: carboxypeptidase regulatory-like domain-containing protein, partial [Pyrinomonadaceae bacterium]|nr:carboxypeptidase regulatory-like domain-containing protein [Pyrinomonadaceae bacterium]